MNRKPSLRGRWVVLGLVGLCALGCLGTLWKYSRIHVSTTNAAIETVDGRDVLVASFADSAPLESGQRATVSVRGQSPVHLKVAGVDASGRALIPLPEGWRAVTGETIEVTVETFVR